MTVAPVNPYRASIARFLAALRNDAPPLAGGADELANLAVLAAMRQSLERDAPVRVSAVGAAWG
ncbi:MAG: hypothetical protein IPK16_05995 [Anaerolineales bacterium]|nr:hypothetical protein [Anaerolineales bacterium]